MSALEALACLDEYAHLTTLQARLAALPEDEKRAAILIAEVSEMQIHLAFEGLLAKQLKRPISGSSRT